MTWILTTMVVGRGGVEGGHGPTLRLEIWHFPIKSLAENTLFLVSIRKNENSRFCPLTKIIGFTWKYFPMPMYTIRLINRGQLVNHTALIRFDQMLKLGRFRNFLYWIYFLPFKIFEQLCAYPEKQSLPWKFSLYSIYFLHLGFFSNLRLPRIRCIEYI